jgi:hypothetical protein
MPSRPPTRPGRHAGAAAGLAAGALVLALVCLSPAAARAQELHGSATLYGWLPWIDGEITTRRGRTATTSISAGDVLDSLNFAFMAAGELHYGRFGLLQDFVYADLGNSGNLSGPLTAKVNVDTNMFLSTTAFGYRAYDREGWQVEPYAGARYVSLENDVKI